MRITAITVMGLFALGCARGEEGASARSAESSETRTSAASEAAGSTSGLPETGQFSDTLWVGVVRGNGRVLPIALYEAGQWSAPWPEPLVDPPEGMELEPPPARAPTTWYLYVEGDVAAEAPVTELLAMWAYCGRTWAQATNWEGGPEERTTYSNTVVGLALSKPLPLVPESEVPDLDQYRSQQGLESNGLDGEGRYRSGAMGFFRLDSDLFGVFRGVGWEGEGYGIHQLSINRRERVLSVSGGGC